MKFWLLTTEYPPFFGGGIGTYCSHTAAMLAKNGHSISVFINDATSTDIDVRIEGNIRVIRFNPFRTKSASYLGHVTNLSYEFAQIVKLFIEKEGQPDVIEAHEYLGIAYYLLQYKHLLYDWCKEVPVLVTMHSPSFLYMEYNQVPQYRYPNFWICEMERFCLQAADYVVSPSHFMVSELKKRFTIDHNRIAVVPNPYTFSEVRGSKNAEEQKPAKIIFYGKLTVQKGAIDLLNYFKELWDNGFPRPLYLLGGQDIVYHPEGITMGDLVKKKYKKYISSQLLKLENRINPVDLENRLDDAEVIIIPSKNDNLPYVVLEMMALGKIVLVSRQGGHTEVVQDGENGFIFDHDRSETFSGKLFAILALDQKERNAIAERAVLKIKEGYNYEVIYDLKIKIIRELLSQFRGNKSNFPFIRPLTAAPVYAEGDEILSIVIPYFNMGKYIDETIESLNKSDIPGKEIIIINDGSDDEFSQGKLDKYRKDPLIKVVDTANNGLAAARNVGSRLARGKYLAFLDSDDNIHPSYFSKAITVLNQYTNVHFAGCWTHYFEGSERTWPAFQPEPPLILYHNMVNSSALVFKRSSFLKAGINDQYMPFTGLEDYDSVISMVSKGLSGIVLPEPLFNYRVRRNSMIRKLTFSKKLLLHQFMVNKHRQFYSDYAGELLQFFQANGRALEIDNPSLDLHLADKVPFGGKISLKIVQLIKSNRYTRRIGYKIYRIINR